MARIKLFEYGPTRSARCRWALLEAGLEFESVERGPALFRSEELKEVHPLGKLPAAVIDGEPLFESVAIVAAIADLVPERNLIAKAGTWARSLHDQWTSFALTEMEAWAWSIFLNTVVLGEEQRIPAALEQNAAMFRRGAGAMDEALGRSDYLVEDRFTATDINCGYTVEFARRQGLTDGFSNLKAYLDRLRARKHCTLDQGGN